MKKYPTDKAEREMGSINNTEVVNPAELAVVAEQEFRYGAQASEAHQKESEKVKTKDSAIKNVPVKSKKSR